jgi:hypothetical protein
MTYNHYRSSFRKVWANLGEELRFMYVRSKMALTYIYTSFSPSFVQRLGYPTVMHLHKHISTIEVVLATFRQSCRHSEIQSPTIFSCAATCCNMWKSVACCTVRLVEHMLKNTSHTEECHKLHHQSGENKLRRISKQNGIDQLRSLMRASTYRKWAR